MNQLNLSIIRFISNLPSQILKTRLKRGELKEDPNQVSVIHELDKFSKELVLYKHQHNKSNLIKKLLSSIGFKSQRINLKNYETNKLSDSPCGIYLYGGVGCGKTMLMDLFFSTDILQGRKIRIHFHEFMLNVHKNIYTEKQSSATKGFNLNRNQPYDPILPIADNISKQTSLICLDEFQVTDIADALILKSLFYHLWKNGVVVFATSNRRPDDLYKNGLQRFHFIPFISMLKSNCHIIHLESVDYRKLASALIGNTFFSGKQSDINHSMDRIYEELLSRSTADETIKTIEVLGRMITFEKTCGKILDTTFNDICAKPLGAIDYLMLCKHFEIILLRNVPQISLALRSEARRFITFIDVLYDNKIKIIMSSEVALENLIMMNLDISDLDKHHAKVLIGDLYIKKGDMNETASIFTGEEEIFAFRRTISRILEMQTYDYWSQYESNLIK